jgi:predicted Rossmann fold flavoprotein
VPTKTEPLFEKVFPASDSALDVRNGLLRDAEQAGASIQLEVDVRGIEPDDARWKITTHQGSITCDRLLLCTGGQSYPKTGTTGDGYRWLRALGLRIVDPVPALVPLASTAPWVRELSGISVDGELSIGDRKRRRPVLFTHKGLSGPAAMDLSEQVSRYGHREASLDLMPDTTREELRALLVEAAGRPGAPALSTLLSLPKRLLATVASEAGLSEANPRLNQVGKAQRHRLIEAVKALKIPISGTLGFAMAEVTSGGLALDEVDRRTMEVKRHPGLHVFGELLDLTGPIGGFSFQAAFSTAELAASAACSALRTQRSSTEADGT